MALRQPAYLQTKTYTAAEDRALFLSTVNQNGIVNSGDYAISGGAGMSINVAAGYAWIKGTLTAAQGIYNLYNNSSVNISITAAHASLPRVDTVIARIYDTTDGGSAQDAGTLEVLTGTATSGATLANLNGAAALTSHSVVIGFVLVPAAAVSSASFAIGGYYKPWSTGAGAVAGAPPAYAFGKPLGATPSARIGNTANQSIPASTATIITFNRVDVDTDTMNSVANRLTFKTPGVYVFGAGYQWAASSTGTTRQADVRMNGATFLAGNGWSQPASGAAARQPIESVYRFGYGDYLELLTFQDTAGAINSIANGSSEPVLYAAWEGP